MTSGKTSMVDKTKGFGGEVIQDNLNLMILLSNTEISFTAYLDQGGGNKCAKRQAKLYQL